MRNGIKIFYSFKIQSFLHAEQEQRVGSQRKKPIVGGSLSNYNLCCLDADKGTDHTRDDDM